MLEFSRRSPEPPELAAFRAANPQAGPDDFNSQQFHPTKKAVKRALNADQGGLCAYCESPLAPEAGQIDHIKPKAGPNAHPQLAFSYSNYVHSCCHEPKHCGQKKGNGLLYIEPGQRGCNDKFTLSTNGTIDARSELCRNERHQVRTTVGQLGMNFSSLRIERERWIKQSLSLMKDSVGDFEAFIADKPFRFILRRLAD